MFSFVNYGMDIMTIWGILEGLISNFIFAVIVFALPLFIGWLWVERTNRRNLQNFFGVSEIKRLNIYLSNITVMRFGAIGVNGRRASFQGESIAYGEILVANRLRNLFSFFIPKLAEIFKPIGKFLLSDVDVQIFISPRKEIELDKQAPLIALGSPVFNAASSYIQSIGNGTVKIKPGEMTSANIGNYSGINPITQSSTDSAEYNPFVSGSFVVPPIFGGTATQLPENYTSPSGVFLNDGIHNSNMNIPPEIISDGLPPITDTASGFVQRIKDPRLDRTLFYVAGISEFSTKGAAYYLATQWSKLQEKYKNDEPFLVMLRFSEPDFTQWSVTFEKSLKS